MIHFSVDDTIEVFHFLTKNNPTSIFEHPKLKFFRTLHNEHNFIVSMYCFYEQDDFNLSMCPDKYKNEFEENSSWLKFGFHALGETTKYGNTDAETFIGDLIKTVDNLKRIVSESAVTYDVRLGFGQGNKNCIKTMKECFDKFNVLYGVDDNRIIYYLSAEENDRYLDKGEFYDESIGITIKHCMRRLECSTEFEETVKTLEEDKFYSFFTHESSMKSERVLEYIKILCLSGQKFIA